LRNKLEEKVNIATEVERIETFHADSQRHLENPQNNSYLHFQTVLECKQFAALEPSGIHSKCVYTIVRFSFIVEGIEVRMVEWVSWRRIIERPCRIFFIARTEELNWDGHEFIINEPVVCCKDSHQYQKISHLPSCLKSCSFESVVDEDQENPD
jgi:hypothetical protein